MAREKIDDTESADRSTADTADDSDEQPATPGPNRPPARSSGTAATAARTRTVMQRRHLRIALAMSLAAGVEIAGAAGLVGGSLLPWEWGEPLWGRTDISGLIVQIATGLVVLSLAVLWWRRGERLPVRLRTAQLLPAAALVALPLAILWRADPGSRGAGPVVVALAAVLVLAGSVAWLVGLKRLRVLFPFGVAASRSRGYGNVAAVRRAQRIGGPAAAVGGVALVAGSLLVAPGWVGTVDSQTTEPLALTGESPIVAGDPAWSMEVPASPDAFPTSVWATGSGLLVEELTGVRLVDPRNGEQRWHWRDGAYRRVAGVLTDGGATVVLGLRHEAGSAGRDRVVALDVGTGELRWERFDDPLVTALAFAAWAAEDGDWFVVPEQTEPAGVGGAGSVRLWALDADGETRWQVAPEETCGFAAVTADAGADVVVTTQQCTGPPGDNGESEDPAAGGCRVSGLDPVTGESRWSWPAAGETAADCQVSAEPGLVLVSSQQEELGQSATALDAGTGEQLWQVGPDSEGGVDGLREPALVGDALVGTQAVTSPTGAGGGELVVRDRATGEVRDRVELPEGQPVEVVMAGSGHAAVSLYRPESEQLVLVDVAVDSGQIGAETVLAGTMPDGALTRATLSSGPQALALEALFAIGEEPGPEDYRMRVQGW